MIQTHFIHIMGHFNLHHHHHPIFKLLYTCLTISCIPFSQSEIKNTRIINDSRPMILFERFGFSEGGHISISVKGVSWKSNHKNADHFSPSSMGFFIVREAVYPRILNESLYEENFCVLSSRYVKLIFDFDNVDERSTIGSPYNGSLNINDPDEYSIVFGNCQPEFGVSMDVHTEMYNLQDGSTKDFLPAGETPLPKLYFLLFLIYSCFLAIWFFICIKQWSTVDQIHLIMGALLVCKALKMICASEDKMYIRKTGTPHGWDVAFYVFGIFKGVMFFTVIVLIGTGWSFLKPYLQEREKNVLMIIIPLQVLENIAYMVINESGPATIDWLAWNHMFLLIDIVCCCAVFFPIVWSIRSLRETSKTDGKATRNLEKLTLFKQFYTVVVGYLYFTRFVVLAFGVIVSYRYEWVMIAAGEGASLAFYVFIFHNFQPTNKNSYLKIGDEEEIIASQVLEEEDSSFEL